MQGVVRHGPGQDPSQSAERSRCSWTIDNSDAFIIIIIIVLVTMEVSGGVNGSARPREASEFRSGLQPRRQTKHFTYLTDHDLPGRS